MMYLPTKHTMFDTMLRRWNNIWQHVLVVMSHVCIVVDAVVLFWLQAIHTMFDTMARMWNVL